MVNDLEYKVIFTILVYLYLLELEILYAINIVLTRNQLIIFVMDLARLFEFVLTIQSNRLKLQQKVHHNQKEAK